MNTEKLVEGMKVLILTAKNEGFSPRETVEALMHFADIMHAAGVPAETLDQALLEVNAWRKAESTAARQLNSTLN